MRWHPRTLPFKLEAHSMIMFGEDLSRNYIRWSVGSDFNPAKSRKEVASSSELSHSMRRRNVSPNNDHGH